MIGLLIPHGQADAVQQVAQLVRAFRWTNLSAVYTSPLERALATAQPLAWDHGLDVRVRTALADVDSGHGEAMAHVQHRILAELMALARSHQGETIAIITHVDPIRCALAALTDDTLDALVGVEIQPGSVSAIGIMAGVRSVLSVNVPAAELAV